jgi:homoserine kinase
VAAHVATLILEEMRPSFGVKLTLRKNMAVGSGLGSSAASSVAAAVAMNAILPRPLPRQDLLRFTMEGERLASGAAHADNVAPCLLGGAVLVRDAGSGSPGGTAPDRARAAVSGGAFPDVVRLPVRGAFWFALAHPDHGVRTEDARSVLPGRIALKDAVRQWGDVAGVVAALAKGDPELLGRCLSGGAIESARRALIPGYEAVMTAARGAGAMGCSISGSGPTLFAVTSTASRARRIARAMTAAFRDHGRNATGIVSPLSRRGAWVQ